MSTGTTLGKTKRHKLGKLPVVVLPLEDYERMREDLEMFCSRGLSRRIRKARGEVKKGKVLDIAEVKERLRL